MRAASPGCPGTPPARDLSPGADRYIFVEHWLDGATFFRGHPRDHRSLLVVRGAVALEHARGRLRYSPGEGWHAPPGAVYRMAVIGAGPAVVIEAGTVLGETTEADPEHATSFDYLDLSGYTVDKPWGYEVWYTSNLAEPGYALKRIHMTAGHQSSLQSHRYKAETNYVVEGEATVLSGLTAPDDVTGPIEVSLLANAVHRAGSGWYSPPGELHRVIARRDYTAIEVSTPELDDVIRWQDDTGRSHGRIESEHAGTGQ
jgi:mannose-6-phosphate isomerase-like protein (cupin superfamily)